MMMREEGHNEGLAGKNRQKKDTKEKKKKRNQKRMIENFKESKNGHHKRIGSGGESEGVNLEDNSSESENEVHRGTPGELIDSEEED